MWVFYVSFGRSWSYVRLGCVCPLGPRVTAEEPHELAKQLNLEPVFCKKQPI